MYFNILEFLQKVSPISFERLLDLPSMTGRVKPFIDHSRGGYKETCFGLYARNPGSANNIIQAIKFMLKIYGFSLNDAYLVVELTPDAAKKYSGSIIENQKKQLYEYIKSEYVRADEIYDTAVRAIDAMNQAMYRYYNNLYLLREQDFDKYTDAAFNAQIRNEKNIFSGQQLRGAIELLRHIRFYDGVLLDRTHKSIGESYIEDGGTIIHVDFETKFLEGSGLEYELFQSEM